MDPDYFEWTWDEYGPSVKKTSNISSTKEIYINGKYSSTVNVPYDIEEEHPEGDPFRVEYSGNTISAYPTVKNTEDQSMGKFIYVRQVGGEENYIALYQIPA